MSSLWTSRPPELTHLLELVNAGVARIKHTLSGWRYDKGVAGAADVMHFETTDEAGEVWTWAAASHGRVCHACWQLKQCAAGCGQQTRLEVDLPAKADLGELLEEARRIIKQTHKCDREGLAALARYRASQRAALPVQVPPPSPQPPKQLMLF